VAYWLQAVQYNIEDESKTGYTRHYAPFEDCPDVFFVKKRARLFTRFKSANGKYLQNNKWVHFSEDGAEDWERFVPSPTGAEAAARA